MVAAMNGDAKTVVALVRAGADVNAAGSESGLTALMLAASQGTEWNLKLYVSCRFDEDSCPPPSPPPEPCAPSETRTVLLSWSTPICSCAKLAVGRSRTQTRTRLLILSFALNSSTLRETNF